MKAKKCILLAVVGILLAMATIAAGQEEVPCTIHVKPGESIQQAVDMAPEGAVICLEKGEWEENITIDKALTLRGAGAEHSVIGGRRDGSVLMVKSPEKIQAILEEVTITNCTISGNGANGIQVEGSSQATIKDCTISNNDNGIVLRDIARATVRNCTVSHNTGWIFGGGSDGNGIVLADASQEK